MLIEGTLLSCLLLACSGLPGLLGRRRSACGQILATVLAAAGAAVGVAAALLSLHVGRIETIELAGILPNSILRLRLDPLSAFFLLPIFVMGGLCPIYGLRYWRQAEHPGNGRKLQLCWGLLIASMAMVTLAGDGVLFLFAWEIMAVSAFFLVSTEDHKAEARKAGWVYLIAAHVGTLILFALFALLRVSCGSFDLRPLRPDEAGLGLQTSMFLLGFVGFGLKAGVMPLHFWLPGAHANAPSHVSAILSGVVLKMGIYGLVRLLTLLPDPPALWGMLVLAFGAASAVLGVVFALGQHDLKRLLAYHSIENIGIILIGLGLAMIGVAARRPEWIVLGMGGCLLHVWNHGLFKALLFLAAGSVVHSARTREIDALGGLARNMPRTAGLFAVGAVAICGLPPLNGFVSELLIYLGLFGTAAVGHAGDWAGVALAAPALALVGALAVACFVKAYGAVFLGTPRTPKAAQAHESPVSMVMPMALIAACCAAIGIAPAMVLPLVERATVSWTSATAPKLPQAHLTELVPSQWISMLAISLLGALLAAAVLARLVAGRLPVREGVTWDCGYARPTSRMQYTASSFAQSLVGLFRWVLRPRTRRLAATGLFPRRAAFHSHVPDLILDGLLLPTWRRVKAVLVSVRVLQQGHVQGYVLYILLALFALLLSLVPVGDLVHTLVGR